MAKNSAAATAIVKDAPASLAALDELDGLDTAELGIDGLEEIDRSDIRIAAKIWNFKGTDAAGDPIAPNVYFDTITEKTAKALGLVLLSLNKTNEWREYDESAGESKIRCRSFDRVTGTTEAGTTRPCAGCPDAQWQTVNGKRTRRCGPVYNVAAVETDTQAPCVLRFKRSSLPAIQQYLQKHFIGRRVVAGRPANYPLFAFETRASLKMSDDKKYALPVLERGGPLSGEAIRQHAESAKAWRDLLSAHAEVIERTDAKSVEDAGARNAIDTSFDVSDDADDKDAKRFG